MEESPAHNVISFIGASMIVSLCALTVVVGMVAYASNIKTNGWHR